MGLKHLIMRSALKKRKANEVFDEAASEVHPFPEHAGEDYNNSFYYASHDAQGNAFFLRLGQRGGSSGPVSEIWFGFCTADGTAYQNSRQLYTLSNSPIRTECIEPLREWKFSFRGKVMPVKAGAGLIAEPCGEEIDAEFEGTFTSQHGLFEFSRDTDIESYAAAVAAEKWRKGFFDELQNMSQVRTEQVGHAECILKVAGKEYSINAAALRDRAYGHRVWSYMNHYSWLVANMEDGSSLNACMVLYPCLNVKGLKSGYYTKNESYIALRGAQFPPYFTVKGTPPTQGNAEAHFADKSRANIELKSKIIFPFQFYDADGGYLVYESITSYVVNGVKGYGIAEFSYNQDRSRYENFRAR